MIDAKNEEIVELSKAEEPQAILDVAKSRQVETIPVSELDFQKTLTEFLFQQEVEKGGKLSRFIQSKPWIIFCLITSVIIAFTTELSWIIWIVPVMQLTSRNEFQISEPQKKRLKKLLVYERVELAGPLCELLGSYDLVIHSVARHVLTNILPNLKEGDGRLLNSLHRKKLRSALASPRKSPLSGESIEFQIAVLKAYETIGTSADLPLVAKIAYSKDSKFGTSVQRAALECLPCLEALVSIENEKVNS